MNWMLKNSAGEPDGSWTLAAMSWAVVSLCLLLSMVQSIGGHVLSLKTPDTTLLLGYLTAMTGNYLLRRNKKDQLAADSDAPETPEVK